MPWEKIFETFLDLIYGKTNQCTLCGRKTAEKQPVCAVCHRDIAYLRAEYRNCWRCGRYISHGDTCVDCTAAEPAFKLARTVGPYQGVLKDYLHRFKYRGYRSMAKGFAHLMAEVSQPYIRWTDIDLVIAVPMFWRKQQKRNYNQSHLLARELAEKFGIPLGTAVLVKIADTPSQTKLAKEQRLANVFDTFRVAFPGAVQGKNILLVDDIITTGSTISECAKVLTAAGAGEINVLAVAAGVTPPGAGE